MRTPRVVPHPCTCSGRGRTMPRCSRARGGATSMVLATYRQRALQDLSGAAHLLRHRRLRRRVPQRDLRPADEDPEAVGPSTRRSASSRRTCSSRRSASTSSTPSSSSGSACSGLSDSVWKFSQTWVWLVDACSTSSPSASRTACCLPAVKRMGVLMREMVDAGPPPVGGPAAAGGGDGGSSARRSASSGPSSTCSLIVILVPDGVEAGRLSRAVTPVGRTMTPCTSSSAASTTRSSAS